MSGKIRKKLAMVLGRETTQNKNQERNRRLSGSGPSELIIHIYVYIFLNGFYSTELN